MCPTALTTSKPAFLLMFHMILSVTAIIYINNFKKLNFVMVKFGVFLAVQSELLNII